VETLRSRIARGLHVRVPGPDSVPPEVGHPPLPRRRLAGWVLPVVSGWLVWRWMARRGGIHRSARDPDAFSLRILAENKHREARAWIGEGKPGDERNLGEQTPAESRAIVDDLYLRGAVDVQVVGAQNVTGFGQTSNILVVQLPTDRAARGRLFDREGELARNEGFDGAFDEGQRYLFLYKFKMTIGQMARALLRGRR
jgi:hypothetical protein